VKNTFLHGTLRDCLLLPTHSFRRSCPDLICRLHKSLYGLKQAPRAWYSQFATYLTTLGFIEGKPDTSLLIFRRNPDTVYLLLYVDEIILTASSTVLLRRTISALQREFAMKDLRPLHHFLDITIEHRPDRLFLHQRTYTLDILKRAVMADCKPCTTPVDLQAKLARDSRPPVEDVSQFWSIARALQYLTFTQPDIAYTVQQICLHMHDPREPHLTTTKRILRYLRRTPDFGLLLRHSSSSDLVAYTDADWVGCPTLDVPRQAMPCSSGITWSPGPPSGRLSSPTPTRKPSTAPWPMVWLRQPGYVSSYMSSRIRRRGALSSTVTTSASCTSPPTPFNISAQSMWRLIFILSERR
jgi:hypothetical protein